MSKFFQFALRVGGEAFLLGTAADLFYQIHPMPQFDRFLTAGVIYASLIMINLAVIYGKKDE
jgi:hypothetical protein